jgi:hypothetical protein
VKYITNRSSLIFLFCLAPLLLMASTRSELPLIKISIDKEFLSPGETYSLRLDVEANGFAYVYSLDPEGYVNLLYPTRPEDGRGEVDGGEFLELYPLSAGYNPGLEHLIAVHTREYRKIKKSRHEFLAPDPEDIKEINSRLTRSDKELDNYALAVIEIDGPTYEEEESVGLSVHNHHYDYWCYFCDCWHPACSHNHCWCGWQVIHHYHSSYHYSHCFMWGGWHSWWRPPVVYVYLEGGSDWDYDTTPWRSQTNWQRRRWQSENWWRGNQGSINEPAEWREIKPRSGSVAHNRKLDRLLADRNTVSTSQRSGEPNVWSTQRSSKADSKSSSGKWSTSSGQPKSESGSSSVKSWKKTYESNSSKKSESVKPSKKTSGAVSKSNKAGKSSVKKPSSKTNKSAAKKSSKSSSSKKSKKSKKKPADDKSTGKSGK